MSSFATSVRSHIARAKDKLTPNATSGTKTAGVETSTLPLDAENPITSASLTSDTPPVTIAVIGAGQRGKRYASYAFAAPHLCKVVAVAEPREKTRELFTTSHKVPPESSFLTYQELFLASEKLFAETGKRLADAVIVAVQDRMHAEVVLQCVAQGFHVLCEKPMATTPEDCIKMADAVEKSGVIFGMGHVLRYSPYNQQITEVLRSGELGQLVNVVQIEPVGYQHFAHSFVRGNWGKEATSSFSLMTKSCHDVDIICHYLYPAKPVRVSSFGSLTHFKKSAKPEAAGAATRCVECPIERECPYSAKRIYLDPVSNGNLGWPASTITDGPPDIESINRALKESPHGLCVYESDNDVNDHQVVNFEFSTGATCSFTMVAYSTLICDRQTRLHFTHGELVGDMYTFTTTNFKLPPGHPQRTVRSTPKIEDGGHGGGDLGMIRAFVQAVKEGNQSILGTDVKEVLRSHLVVFAAEKSRKEGVVVNIEDYESGVRAGMSMQSNTH